MSAMPSSTDGKNVERKKRKLEKAKLVRARRRTIDPTKWDSQHLKGAFLDSVIVADDDGSLPVATPSQPHTLGDREESDTSSGEEEDEEKDESDTSEYESVAEELLTTPAAVDRPPPTAPAEQDTIDADQDFNQEKLRALSLLDSMFGGLERDQEWGGKEQLDSDVELPPSQASPSPAQSSSHRAPKDTDLMPVIEEVQEDSSKDESSATSPAPSLERAPTPVTTQSAATTKAKLKDLFAPQEEQGALLLGNHLL